MKITSIIFFVSLLFGQLGAIRILPGVTVYLHDVTLGILLLSFLFGKKCTKAGLPKLVWLTPLFGVVALISILIHVHMWSPAEITQSLLYLGRWLYYYSLFVIVVYSYVPRDTWLKGLYLSGVGLAIVGLVQFIYYPSLANLSYLGWDPYYYRVFSALLDPNFTGILLTLTFILGLYMANTTKQKMYLATQLFVLVALVLTSSRSSFMALGAGVLTYTIIKKQWKWLTGFMMLVALYLIVPKPAMEAFRLDRTVSAFARINNWNQSIELFKQEPVLGKGFSNKQLIQSDVHVVEGVPSNSGSGIDSSLLFVLATTGVVGFVVYVDVIKNILSLCVVALNNKKIHGLGIVGLVWIVSLLVHSIFTNSLLYPWVLIYVWILVGVIQRHITYDT